MKFPLRESHVQAGKRFVLQILNTSLAVIIALAFEGLVERKRIHDLVATAAEHMRSELRANRQDITATRAEVERSKREMPENLRYVDSLLAAIEARLAGKQPGPVNGGITFRSMHVILNFTSRSTAEATGALGHMPYDQVKRFAETYNYQQAVQDNLNRLHEQSSLTVALANADLRAIPLGELKELRACFANIQRLVRELSGQLPTLLQFYDQALAAR